MSEREYQAQDHPEWANKMIASEIQKKHEEKRLKGGYEDAELRRIRLDQLAYSKTVKRERFRSEKHSCGSEIYFQQIFYPQPEPKIKMALDQPNDGATIHTCTSNIHEVLKTMHARLSELERKQQYFGR